VLPGSRHLRLPGSVCRSSVLRSSEVLPGSGDLRLPGSVCRFPLLPGSGHVLCAGDLCAEVLCSGSGELLRSSRSDLQYVQQLQYLQQLAARLARHVPSHEGRLLPDDLHDDQGLLRRSLRSC
jgi:hypothetical protein